MLRVTLWYSNVIIMMLLTVFCNYCFQHGQYFSAPEFNWYDPCLVFEHSVKLDPAVLEVVGVFHDTPFEGPGDCSLLCCCVVQSAQQGFPAGALHRQIADSLTRRRRDTFFSVVPGQQWILHVWVCPAVWAKIIELVHCCSDTPAPLYRFAEKRGRRFFFFCVPSYQYISVVHHFGWDFHVRDRFLTQL